MNSDGDIDLDACDIDIDDIEPTVVDELEHEESNEPEALPSTLQSHRPSTRTRAGIKIASLNMNGRFHNGEDKWRHINQVMRDERIGILALQETHLTVNDAEDLQSSLAGQRLHILSTLDPDHPNRAGVAIVVNKYLANTEGIQTKQLVKGHALYASIPWHKSHTINILAVYAPTTASKNEKLWKDVLRELKRLHLKPDILLGDLNMTEDGIDRLPPHSDSASTISAFQDLKHQFNLIDGWRRTNPTQLRYTYMQTEAQGGSQSRIDRIYIREDAWIHAHDWEIQATGIHTDHFMTSVYFSDRSLPYIGPGRWNLPLHLTTNEIFLDKVVELCSKAVAEADAIEERTGANNIQAIFERLKDDIRNLAKKIGRTLVSKLDVSIQGVTDEINRLATNRQITNTERKSELTALTAKLRSLMSEKHQKTRDKIMATYRLESECSTSKLWAKTGRERIPRDTITELRVPSEGNWHYERRSDKMAELAKNYHDGLQDRDVPEHREGAIDEVLSFVSRRLSDRDKERLATKITKEDVAMAIKEIPNGKATGVNGLPNELWKELARRFDRDTNPDRRGREVNQGEHETDVEPTTFDVAAFFTRLFNDVEEHGVLPGSRFAEGWICPLYKKGDKRDIANYRPITVLNSDYKLMTKIMSNKLAQFAPTIIHKDQAGFVPGRSIADQVRLTQMIQDYAEIDADGGGIIIGLDQEKAYDKVDHNYLWRTLEKFNLPDRFIQTVRTLYENAHTSVMINGENSGKYKVRRGVRQGCPLSCLLFDLAIEPLAEMIRRSSLRGFKTPEMKHRIVVSMFADDTTVYLSRHDDIYTLLDILKTWCTASTAKFNIEKTEVIPIGPEEYRLIVITTRKLSPQSREIPNNMRIAKEGEARRFLGAWIGNRIDEEGVWSPTLEKITASLRRWELSKPTINGRRIILQWTVAGMTQYLADVQGMPARIESRLDKICREFGWDNTGKSLINAETMKQDFDDGGARIPCIKDRNDAITLKQIRDYLAAGDSEKTWSPFMRAIIANHASQVPRTSLDVRNNPFIQEWNPNTSNLPSRIKRMVSVAKKYGVRLEVLEISPALARAMPAWSHPGMNPTMRKLQNGVYADLLRKRHRVYTVGDLEALAKSRDGMATHTNSKECPCLECENDRQELGCGLNPSKCVNHAKAVLASLPDKWHPDKCRERQVEIGESDTGDVPSSLRADGIPEDHFRVFIKKSDRVDRTRAHSPDQQEQSEAQIVHIYSSINWTEDGRQQFIAMSVTGEEDSPEREYICIDKGLERSHTQDAAELTAAIEALEKIPPGHHTTIHFQSSSVHHNLTAALEKMERQNWPKVHERETYKSLIATIRVRRGGVAIRRHHNRIPLIELGMAASHPARKTTITTDAHNETKINRMVLKDATQAMLHRGVREFQSIQYRKTTMRTLRKVSDAITKQNGRRPDDRQIWKASRDKHISKNIRNFIWKSLHDAYRLGKKWNKIPGHEDRKECKLCGQDESMEHILLQCPNSEAIQTIWSLAERLWTLRERSWPQLDYGTIMGANMLKFKSSRALTARGRNRLFTILVTESMHLIWKLRCERVIQRKNDPNRHHSRREITNKWVMVINTRLKLDMLHVNKKWFGKKAIRKSLVEETWRGVLKDDKNLPDDWVWQSGGLVGIEPLP